MDHKAVLLALVLVSGSLAGCTGDPDGGGGDEFDAEALQDLIDENLQDFLNNTSITVINNYHNNTTYVIDDSQYTDITNVEYNNTTIVDGGTINNYVTDNSNHSYGFGPGVNATVGSNGLLFVVHLEWTAMDMFPEYDQPGDRNNSFEYIWTYWDYPTQQQRTDTFQFDCTEYYLFETVSASNNTSYWGTYWESNDPYYDAWDNQYNDTIAELLQTAGGSDYIQQMCNDDYVYGSYIVGYGGGGGNGTSPYQYNFFNLIIPEGYAIKYQQQHFYMYRANYFYSNYADYNGFDVDQGPNPEYYSGNNWMLYGGWDDLSIGFYMGPGSYTNTYIWPDCSYEYTLYYELIPVIQDTE